MDFLDFEFHFGLQFLFFGQLLRAFDGVGEDGRDLLLLDGQGLWNARMVLAKINLAIQICFFPDKLKDGVVKKMIYNFLRVVH